jgi:hypothetical protein
MERAMMATGLAESSFHRTVVIAGATAAVILALLCAKHFTTSHPGPASAAERVADQKPEIELASITASPTIEANPQFLYGSGDGSNGYYAERPPETLVLVRYQRMP